jgi:hypothetical protein
MRVFKFLSLGTLLIFGLILGCMFEHYTASEVYAGELINQARMINRNSRLPRRSTLATRRLFGSGRSMVKFKRSSIAGTNPLESRVAFNDIAQKEYALELVKWENRTDRTIARFKQKQEGALTKRVLSEKRRQDSVRIKELRAKAKLEENKRKNSEPTAGSFLNKLTQLGGGAPATTTKDSQLPTITKEEVKDRKAEAFFKEGMKEGKKAEEAAPASEQPSFWQNFKKFIFGV